MKKSRIILADIDENYLTTLEMKFLTELGDDIDLEVISSKAYFDRLFSKPQSTGVLAVSEELFDESLRRHAIGTLFILTENNHTDERNEAGAVYLYKYCSVKELFTRIMGASGGLLKMRSKGRTGTRVVLTYSPAGGTGKTTIALGISACFVQNHRKALYINASRMNTFQDLLKDGRPIDMDVCRMLSQGEKNTYGKIKHLIRSEGFDYLPPFPADLSSLNIRYRFYKDLIASAAESGDYDLIVADTDSVFDEDKSDMISAADRVLMITTQKKYSVCAMNVLLKNLNAGDHDKFCYIGNDHDPERTDPAAQEKADFLLDETIRHLDDPENMDLSELGRNEDIQRISYLLA